MCNFANVLDQLDQFSLPVFCDEGVYHIAKQIQLQHHDKFPNLLLMLGNFHGIKVVLGCIGKSRRGSGVEDWLLDTGAYGAGTMPQALDAADYAKSLRAFSRVGEALRRLQIEAFFDEYPIISYQNDLSVYQLLQDILDDKCHNEGKVILDDISKSTYNLVIGFETFSRRRCEESPLFKFWNNFLLMHQLVLDTLRADRTGD